MKRPAFQFYPADWRNNANLRRCSWAARGIWIEVMGLFHDSDEYGILRWPLKEMAQALGAPLAIIRELAEKGVMKGCDKGECDAYVYVPRSGRKNGEPVTLVSTQAGPIWYSSRMVRDEHVRTLRGEGTRFSDGKDEAPKPSPKGGLGEAPKQTPMSYQSDGPTSTSSPSVLKPSCTNVQLVGSDASNGPGECPHQEIIALYKQHLPTLTVPRIWDEARQKPLRAQWQKLSKANGISKGYGTRDEGLAFWGKYFRFVASDTTLPDGFPRENGSRWYPDLPWLIKPENFKKVVEGNYARE